MKVGKGKQISDVSCKILTSQVPEYLSPHSTAAHLWSTYYEPENNLRRVENIPVNKTSISEAPFTELTFIWGDKE